LALGTHLDEGGLQCPVETRDTAAVEVSGLRRPHAARHLDGKVDKAPPLRLDHRQATQARLIFDK
jgi:hypothetical protein